MSPGAPERLVPTPYVVRERWNETADVFSMALEPADAASLRPGAPGQFNMLWAFGVGEAPISLSGCAAETEGSTSLVHTIRSVGNVTRTLGTLDPGDVVGVHAGVGVHGDGTDDPRVA